MKVFDQFAAVSGSAYNARIFLLVAVITVIAVSGHEYYIRKGQTVRRAALVVFLAAVYTGTIGNAYYSGAELGTKEFAFLGLMTIGLVILFLITPAEA